jgi:hypothetical protein
MKSEGFWARRAKSTLPRVMREFGGPFEASTPWPEKKAGGLRFAGERASWLPEACSGSKYDCDAALDDVDGGCCVGVSVGVVGFVTRRLRGELGAPGELGAVCC